MDSRDAISIAAQAHMPVQCAQELANNLAMGLRELDASGSSELQRYVYVLGAINHRIEHFGLRVMCPEDAAAKITDASGAEIERKKDE